MSRICARWSQVKEGVVELGGTPVMVNVGAVVSSGEEGEDARVDWGWLDTMNMA